MSDHQDQLKQLSETWDKLQRDDENKNSLINGLFDHIKGLTKRLGEAEMELRDRKDMLDLKRAQLDRNEKRFQELERQNERHIFTMVVIDGDNMPFQDELVKEGLSGGKKTASLLKQAVEEEIKEKLPSIPQHAQVMIRVYANMKGLSKKYKEVLPELGSFDDFVRGFNTVDPLCDYIDAGNGKECADEKIKASFKFGLNDVHCRQIFFGGAADNGYARLLDSYLEDKAVCDQITLLEGPPFAYEMAQLKDKFKTVFFEKVFRSKQLPNNSPINRRASVITPPGSPLPSYTSMDYASAAAKAPIAAPGLLSPSPEPRLPSISHTVVLRNKLGQRVDSRLSYSQHEYMGLKDRKLCNNFHLLGRCYYFDKYGKCHHEHGEALTHNQKEALRAIARQSPCSNGLSCSETDCVSGHHCPRNPCTLTACWFAKEMHDVDQQVAS